MTADVARDGLADATVAASPRRHVRDVIRSYVALTKPRIIEQLLVTTVPAMFLAERGFPAPVLLICTLVGGALAAGSAGVFNCVVDADIDAVMKRTKARPLVRHEVPTRNAVIFGVVLGVGSFVLFAVTANLLAAVLAVAAILFYVLVYTMLLKRRTSQNVVWGGLCGCMPVLVGWAAVRDTISWPALVMFGVIFFWTPPHSWALAMKFRDDYERAGVPMLPVRREPAAVSLRIVLYAWAMALCTLLLVPALSWLYAVFAVVLGAWFLVVAHRLHNAVRRGETYQPMKVFHVSNTYLCGVFVMVAVDAVIGWHPLGWPF